MLRIIQIATVLAAFGLVGPGLSSALACPMCKEAVEETGTALPRAYMYSIIFMLGVPAAVLTSFGVGFYRLSRSKQQLEDADDFSSADMRIDDAMRG